MQPQLLLMDEPCSSLDPISILAIDELIGELKEQFTPVRGCRFLTMIVPWSVRPKRLVVRALPERFR